MSADIAAAAEALLEARRTRRWLAALPERARPGTDAEAYAIQDWVAQALGEVGGGKSAPPRRSPSRSADPSRPRQSSLIPIKSRRTCSTLSVSRPNWLTGSLATCPHAQSRTRATRCLM
jgi:hypothetical protein